VTFNRKGSVDGNVLFPRHSSDTFKQFVKTVCARIADNKQNPLPGSDIYIRFRYIAYITGKQNPPVFRFNIVMI
jgi:hypothetical protein